MKANPSFFCKQRINIVYFIIQADKVRDLSYRLLFVRNEMEYSLVNTNILTVSINAFARL